MDDDIKRGALRIISVGIANIIRNYTENALLINACFVCSDRYSDLTGTDGLSTTANIPPELRLDNEIDVQYTNDELVEKYGGDVLNVIFKNYIIVSISTVDAILEELYEFLLTSYEPDITSDEVDKKIRNIWGNNNLLNYLTDTDKSNLQRPTGMETGFSEALIRYLELRIIRHTLIHTSGIISDKNYTKLEEFLNDTPDIRKHFALINSPLIDGDRKISLSINKILSIRQYLDKYLMYLYTSIQNT